MFEPLPLTEGDWGAPLTPPPSAFVREWWKDNGIKPHYASEVPDFLRRLDALLQRVSAEARGGAS